MEQCSLITVFILIISSHLEAAPCIQKSCHGDVGNLAAGRFVSVSNTCEHDDDLDIAKYCQIEDDNCDRPKCEICRDDARGISHPASHMVDSTFSKNRTYWQSKLMNSDKEKASIRFDLETAFYFTHLIMVFKTPRPGAMVLERSADFGKTWQIYQRYAKDCREEFGIVSDEDNVTSGCTMSYSSEEPCSGGEVIYRVLNPVDPMNDPYSIESKYLLKITNLRIKMWSPQLCSKCNVSEKMTSSFRHFAVYDLIFRGTCFCNGHADSCVAFPKESPALQQSRQAVVHGKCICEHNTRGDHCDKCMPLYNDAPWRPGNGYTGQPNACKKCNCNSHAESCHFDRRIWSLTGETSGGVCDDCRHNTTGRRCDRCKVHFFRRADSDLTDLDVCQECNCHPNGTLSVESASEDLGNTISAVMSCDATSGQCYCKFGVTGRRCDRCKKGFWGLMKRGCQRCLCSTGFCDQVSGNCLPDYGDSDQSFVAPDNMLRFPVESIPISPFQFPDFDQMEKAAATSRRHRSCICKEKNEISIKDFCTKNYDYAIKGRILGAEDDGTTTVVSLAVRRVITQNRVKISKGKMLIYPESWTMMGCTCPALIPRKDYIIVGHEDRDANRLIINTHSFVKQLTHKKNWARVISRVLRSSQCIRNEQ